MCFFCTVTAFVHPPGPCPAQPLLLYVDSPLITFEWPTVVGHTCSVGCLCGDCLLPYKRHFCFLSEQRPSCSTDLFMRQADGCDTPLLALCCDLNVKEPHFEGWPLSLSLRLRIDICITVASHNLRFIFVKESKKKDYTYYLEYTQIIPAKQSLFERNKTISY